MTYLNLVSQLKNIKKWHHLPHWFVAKPGKQEGSRSARQNKHYHFYYQIPLCRNQNVQANIVPSSGLNLILQTILPYTLGQQRKHFEFLKTFFFLTNPFFKTVPFYGISSHPFPRVKVLTIFKGFTKNNHLYLEIPNRKDIRKVIFSLVR